MKIITIFLLLLPAAICHAQDRGAAREVASTIDVINRTNNISKTSFDKNKWYVVKFVNLNPLLFDLKTSSENKIVPVSNDDNILQTLFNTLNQSTGKNVNVPAAPEAKDIIAENLTKDFKKPDEKTKAVIKRKSNAFDSVYKEFKNSISDFKKAQLHIQDLVLFCNQVTGYCYDPLLPRDRIKSNMESNNVIQSYITGLEGGDPTGAVLIRKAGSLSTALNDAYNNCLQQYAALKKVYEKLKEGSVNTPTSAIDIVEASEQSVDDVKAAYDKFKPTDLTTLASKTGEAYTIVYNSSFEREVPVYCGDVDSVITTMEIVALDKNTTVPGMSPVKLEMNVVGGLRTFTAAGLMVNFFNVRDDKYYIDADSTVRRASRRNAAFPSLAMLQTFYFKNAKSAVWGGSIGLSANLNNLTSLTDLRLFLGPSFITTGGKLKFVISGGITAGYSEELKGDFEKDKKVSALMLNQEQNKLTDKYFRFGAYVGFAIKIL